LAAAALVAVPAFAVAASAVPASAVPAFAATPVAKGGVVIVVPPEAYDPTLHHDVIDDKAPRSLWSIVLSPKGKPFISKERCDILAESVYRQDVVKVQTHPTPANKYHLRKARVSHCERSDGSALFVPGIKHLDDVKKPHVDRITASTTWPY
jgi:hypothetical protein